MQLINGDSMEELKKLSENSVDTIITDPPYGLKFMGKKWDYDIPSVQLWAECLRVLKPGGTLLCFAGSRTQHRMAINIEQSGFILKDCIMYLYGSGFPKATDIKKQLTKFGDYGIMVVSESNGGMEYENKSESNPKYPLRLVWKTDLQKTKPVKEAKKEIVQQGVQEQDVSIRSQQFSNNEGAKQSCMERWSYIQTNTRELSKCQICAMSERIYIDGKEGWLCHGAQANDGKAYWEMLKKNRSCTSYKSRSVEQSNIESNSVPKQFCTQEIRSDAEDWNGWKSHGLKPSYEPVLACFKPLTIKQFFCIILSDITNLLKELLCKNLNVKDVENIFTDIQAKLKKELGHIVVENVRTNFWEQLKYVKFVDQNSMSKNVDSQTLNLKQDSAHINVKESGNQDIIKPTKSDHIEKVDIVDQITQHGGVGSIYAKILDIVISVMQENISENIVLLWRNTLEELLNHTKQFTIKTATNLTIALKILRSSLIQITSKNIGNLFPNYNPIIVAMKPNEGTYAENALKHGVAGLNIDGGRIKMSKEDFYAYKEKRKSFDGTIGDNLYGGNSLFKSKTKNENRIETKGRFPANIILDEEAARQLDEQSGVTISKKQKINNKGSIWGSLDNSECVRGHNDSGGASRFFYCAKASKAERNVGCKEVVTWENVDLNLEWEELNHLLKDISDDMIQKLNEREWNIILSGNNIEEAYQKDIVYIISMVIKLITELKTYNSNQPLNIKDYILDVIKQIQENGSNLVENVAYINQLEQNIINDGMELVPGVVLVVLQMLLKIKEKGRKGNVHSTVKPLKLMEYLCILTKTPTGGTVLDPFMGSGTTGIACKNTGRDFIGIELSAEYFEIAKARIENTPIDK